MKQGRKPNNAQKKAMSKAGINFEKWLVTRNLPYELHIVHRETGQEKVIPV